MAVYAVGDIQGCYSELMDVLEQVDFDPGHDQLWVVGDIVNRGDNCKATLKFIYEHRDSVRAVLGNHDLHLLAIYHGVRKARRSDTFNKILASPRCDDWMQWLQGLPLCWHSKKLNYTLVHAGIAPQWNLKQALALSSEVEKALQGKRAIDFLENMYGDEPNLWRDDLKGMARLRCITNYFTRMRLVDRAGALNLGYKNDLEHVPDGYYPWFLHPERKNSDLRIIFGHWAALGGYINNHNLFGLDSGCVWGRSLTLMKLKTHDLFVAEARG